VEKPKSKPPEIAPTKLSNPYEGDPAGRQLNETVDEFLERMPVQDHEPVGPWLWISNFQAPRGTTHDEVGFIKKGRLLLDCYMSKRAALESEDPDIAPATVTLRLRSDRLALQSNILQLAAERGVVTGKVTAPNLSSLLPS
jgi:Domain of unknown function (DUF1917)